jgi:hypothetical protein
MRARNTYTLIAKEVEGFGGEVVLERWWSGRARGRGGDEVRVLLIEKNAWALGERRAGLVMSRREAERFARGVLAVAKPPKRPT